MDTPLEITFHNLDRSESIVAAIREKYEQLERFYHHMISMKVTVDMPEKYHHHGNHYQVTIAVTVLGQRLVAGHSSDKRVRHLSPLPTISNAFEVIMRKLQDYVCKRRGDVNHNDIPPMGRVARMFPDYDFIILADGREVYFRKNSVFTSETRHLRWLPSNRCMRCGKSIS